MMVKNSNKLWSTAKKLAVWAALVWSVAAIWSEALAKNLDKNQNPTEYVLFQWEDDMKITVEEVKENLSKFVFSDANKIYVSEIHSLVDEVYKDKSDPTRAYKLKVLDLIADANLTPFKKIVLSWVFLSEGKTEAQISASTVMSYALYHYHDLRKRDTFSRLLSKYKGKAAELYNEHLMYMEDWENKKPGYVKDLFDKTYNK